MERGRGVSDDWDDNRTKRRKRTTVSRSVKRAGAAAVLMLVGFMISTGWSRLTSSEGKGSGGGVPNPPSQSAKEVHEPTPAPPPLGTSAKGIKDVTEEVRKALAGGSGGPNLATDQQIHEWAARVVELAFVTGEGSCDGICSQAKGMRCARDWFAYVDTCKVAEAVFPGAKPCVAAATKAGAPGLEGKSEHSPLEVSGGSIVVNADARTPPMCSGGLVGGTRLCPCVAKERARQVGVDGLKEVSSAVQLYLERQQEYQEKKMREEEEKAGLAARHVNATLDPQSPLQLARAGRVAFVRGLVGESCDNVCGKKERGLTCASEWFKHINKCDVLIAAWPKSSSGDPHRSCYNGYYGHDLPGFQFRKTPSELLLNNDLDVYPSTCAGSSATTERLCPCEYRYPKGKARYHTVFSVQSKQYFEWQSRYQVFWHKQSGQPGKLTRLLSMGGAWPRDPRPHPFGDHLMKQVPTHVAPEYDPMIDPYTAYNKPLSISHWLQTTTVEEDIIIILDPDCAFINRAEHRVEEGSPIAAQGYYTFKEKAGHEMDILKHYCRGICTHFDPVAVPVMIHRNDLERLAPLWLKYTEDIRADRQGVNKWPIQWNDNKYVVNRIEWVAEMFGYVLAAAHLGLRHEIVPLQNVPSVNRKLSPGVPILHFHVPVETSTKEKWGKTDQTAGWKSPWPVPAGTDEVSARMFTALHDAREALGQTERTRLGKWGDYYAIWLNPQNETEPT